MNFLRANFLSLLPLLLMVVASLLLYPDLPDALPGSFDFDGELQRTSPKLLMVVLMPAGFVGLVLAINLLIRISPHKYSLPNSKRPMDIILIWHGHADGIHSFRSVAEPRRCATVCVLFLLWYGGIFNHSGQCNRKD